MSGKTLRVAVRSSTEVYSFSQLGAEPERISSWHARRVRVRPSPRSPGHGHRHRRASAQHLPTSKPSHANARLSPVTTSVA